MNDEDFVLFLQIFFDALVQCLGRGSHWFQTLYNTLQVYGIKGMLNFFSKLLYVATYKCEKLILYSRSVAQ